MASNTRKSHGKRPADETGTASRGAARTVEHQRAAAAYRRGSGPKLEGAGDWWRRPADDLCEPTAVPRGAITTMTITGKRLPFSSAKGCDTFLWWAGTTAHAWRIVHEEDKHRFDRSRSHGGRPCARPGNGRNGNGRRNREYRPAGHRQFRPLASRAMPERPPQAARARDTGGAGGAASSTSSGDMGNTNNSKK